MHKYSFEDRFEIADCNGQPPNWVIENHASIDPYRHARVGDGRFEIHTPAQRYLIVGPALESLTFSLRGAFNPGLSDEAVLRLLFHYDTKLQHGYGFDLVWTSGRLDCALIEVNRRRVKKLDSRTLAPNPDFDSGKVALTVRIDGNAFRLAVSRGPEMLFDNPGVLPHGGGAVGVQKGVFPAPFLLESVTLESDDPLEHEVLVAGLAVEFPDLNGQQVPLRYGLQVRRTGPLHEITVRLSGGAFEKPDVPGFTYHGRVIDRLTRPYLRIGNRPEDVFHLHSDTLVMANVKGQHFYGALFKRPAWPLERRFWVETLDLDAPVFLGYEHYQCSAARHAEGGPAEIAVDLHTGRILDRGPRVLSGECALELHSPADKQVCALLPREDPRHEKALAFARCNHFFLENEPCRFSARVRYDMPDLQPGELTLRVRLLDVFLDPLQEARIYRLSLDTPSKAVPQSVDVALDGPGILPPGVYHLDLRLMQGLFERAVLRKAFEVMPAAREGPSAPLLSGLPVLYSSATETMGLETDAFDPWAGLGIDACHYVSMVSFVPEFARQARTWLVTGVYGRPWFVWLTTRTTPRIAIAENADILAHCDYLNIAADEKRYHLYLWKCNLYKDVLLEQLNAFLETRGLPAVAGMTEDIFRDTVLPRWREWIAYFCHWLCRDRLPEQQRLLRAVNPGIRRSDYGPVNSYCSCYKSAHSMLIRGLDPRLELERQYDGFFQYEDYPFAAGYAIHAKTYTLASMKLENPRLRYYPEIYSGGGGGCPDSAVGYANPPYGAYAVPPPSVRKRVYESAYATVWHDRNGFAYWRDYGFHARNWSNAMYEHLLRAWKTVRRVKPLKPLRSTAFLYSRELCLAHPNFYRPAADSPYPGGEVCNTAEECVAFAYDVARSAGLPAGFTASLDSLERLDPADVDLLVLPPLGSVPPILLERIRALHAAGVNLLAFESVEGLEDLFGVEPLETPVRITGIRPARDFAAVLPFGEEYPGHPDCVARYRVCGARAVLTGDRETPVLIGMRNGNRTGAVLWNIPPTLVRREDFFERGLHGRENISPLIRHAAAWALRTLSGAPVSTTQGKLIAFRDTADAVQIIISEDAHPAPAKVIRPLITIRMPGLSAGRITCDREHSIVALTPAEVALRLELQPHECARITLKS